MKKIIWVFGLIAGAILSINAIVHMNMMYDNPNLETNDFLGYAFMLLVFSLIFFGVRNYRNKHLGGHISFGKAFKTGALIALVASTLYVGVSLIYYYLFVPDFMDVYTEFVLNKTDPADLAAKTAEMENFKELSKNPLFVVLMTYFEVLPIGIVVALISAFILKKKGNV